MKWTALYSALAVCLLVPPVTHAQVVNSASGGAGQPASSGNSGYKWNHVEIGAYADYFRFGINGTDSNFLGLGARVGVNVQPHVALEAEGNYDFARNYTSTVTTTSGTTTVTTTTKSNIRPITAVFGPKFQMGSSGPVRAFITGKVGLIDFSTTNSAGALSSIGNTGTYFAAYPGGGIEFFGGPVGVRIEAGDEMFLNNGVYNNLRATIGPTFRF